MKGRKNLAVIGSGASAIYFLHHLFEELENLNQRFEKISIFERTELTGFGMPYSPQTTDSCHMANIASVEIPELPMRFAPWLVSQDDKVLDELGIKRDGIDEEEIYSRITLGRYLRAQYLQIVQRLREAGMEVVEYPETEIVDLKFKKEGAQTLLESSQAETFLADVVVIATGHSWDAADAPERGYFASPWPIFKLLPKKGELLNYNIGTLGASLSAFDVVASLTHRHGTFKKEGNRLSYEPLPGTEDFLITLHSSQGLLPHLQYEQQEPMREIYRHATKEKMESLLSPNGELSLDAYFDNIARPALARAAKNDKEDELAQKLEAGMTLEEFIEDRMGDRDYREPFAGMRIELKEMEELERKGRPSFWEETLDDLIYMLNFYAERMNAKDRIRFKKEVAPFLMNVIAALPFQSAKMLLALFDAGKIELIAGHVEMEEKTKSSSTTKITIDDEGKISQKEYRLFVNCGGQKALELDDYPFQSLVSEGVVRRARAKFENSDEALQLLGEEAESLTFTSEGVTYLATGGVDITDSFQVVGTTGKPIAAIYDISFPHTTGNRPYSYGLQACNETARLVVESWVKGEALNNL